MSKKIKESKGLKTGSQTTGLNNENRNRDITKFPIRILQDVLVHTSRKGAIKMVNTILKNLGDGKNLTPKDNSQKLDKTIENILQYYSPSLADLVDWENCNDIYVWKRSNELRKTKLRLWACEIVGRGECYLSLTVESWEKDLWYNIIKQFGNSEWIMDLYLEPHYAEKIYQGSFLSENKNGKVTIQEFSIGNLYQLELISPVHFGNLIIEQLDNVIDFLPVGSGDIDKENFSEWDTVLSYIDPTNKDWTEMSKCIERYKRMGKIKEYQWRGFVRLLHIENKKEVRRVDKFAPYYLSFN